MGKAAHGDGDPMMTIQDAFVDPQRGDEITRTHTFLEAHRDPPAPRTPIAVYFADRDTYQLL